MTRDIRGKPVGKVAPDKDLKVPPTETGKEAADKPRDPGAIEKLIETHDKLLGEHDEQLDGHHSRIEHLEHLVGLAKKRDGEKDEDQGGKAGNPGTGHDEEKSRRRHS